MMKQDFMYARNYINR